MLQLFMSNLELVGQVYRYKTLHLSKMLLGEAFPAISLSWLMELTLSLQLSIFFTLSALRAQASIPRLLIAKRLVASM